MQSYDFVVLVGRWYWELFNLYGKNKQNCLLLVSTLLGKEKTKFSIAYLFGNKIIVENLKNA